MIPPPMLDPRDEAAVAASLIAAAPAYTPEWSPHTNGPAYAVLTGYARFRSLLNVGLSQLPNAHQAAMLDLLGAQLLPAQGARVPLVFTVATTSTRDITLAQGSQVAAIQAAVLPSLEPDTKPTAPAEPPVFATERTVTLTPGRLVSLASIDPGSDRYADHSAHPADGFELFSAMQLTPHELYLGHDTLFALGGNDITLIVGMLLQQPAAAPMTLQWEYLADSGWVPLPHAHEDDTTGGLTSSGQVTLRRVCGPNAKKAVLAGHESFWIRVRLTSPLIVGWSAREPVINDVRVRVKFSKKELLPEAAFADVVALDVTKHFQPFGQRPGEHACCYIASKEVFARGGARVRMSFDVSTAGMIGTLATLLTWEYFSSAGWAPFASKPPDGATTTDAAPFNVQSLVKLPGIVAFTCPTDWVEADVNGVRNYWLRIRLTAGNFGTPLVFNATAAQPFIPATFQAPVLKSLTLAFEYLTDPEPVQHALTHNNFRFTDVTAAALWPDQTFTPFVALDDVVPAIHLGFDRPLPDGLGSLFAHCPTVGAGSGEPSRWQWEYVTSEGWRGLSVIDETAGFQRSGMIQFIGPRDAVASSGLHGTLYRIRARLKRGESFSALPVAGLWLNAVWAVDQQTSERELLGRSDGIPGQRLAFRHAPVLAGEQVEIEEWVGRGDTWRLALADVAGDSVRIDRDPVTGEALSVWVRWSPRTHLHDAGPGDRVYTLERATGVLRFGPQVPVAGRRVLASYRSGGGLRGNVGVAQVTQSRLAQPLLTAVTNPIAAAGGADVETLAKALRRGPQGLRHRQRALAVQDIEWLAREATPEIARVRCLPLRGPDGQAQRGHYTVLIAPYSTAARPAPTEILARVVADALAHHAPATVRLRVLGPRYLSVSVRAVIVPLVAGEAALVEERVRLAIDRFLHPLLGGTQGDGWRFGEAVPLSQIAALIGSLPGVAYAQGLVLTADGTLCGDFATPAADVLPCAGAHELVIKLGDCA